MNTLSIYVVLFACVYLYLTLRVIRLRREYKTSSGDGGHQVLSKAIDAHANFAQYVPFALLLLVMLTLQGVNEVFLHILSILLLLARAGHAYGISQEKENFNIRTYSMIVTITVISTTALALLVVAIINIF